MEIIILGKEKMAEAINFCKYPVLSINLDNKPYADEDFIIGCECRVAWDKDDGQYNGMTTTCTLQVESGRYYLSSHGTMLKAHYSVDDFIDNIRRANLPLVHKGQLIAVAHYSKELEFMFVRLMRVSEKIDVSCQTVAILEDPETL